MSYILDAIAKSEQERRQLEIPGAESLSIPSENTKQNKSRLALFVVGALLLNAVVIALWLQTEKSAEMPMAQVVEVEPEKQIQNNYNDNREADPAEPVVSEKEVRLAQVEETVAETPAVEPTEEPAQEVIQDETEGWVRIEPDSLSNSLQQIDSPRDTQIQEPGQLVVSQLHDLPASVRKDLPTVKFSGHLYSSNPASSVVFLDNQRPVMQGQLIVDEVFLHEITRDGVIVKFRNYLIGVGVLQNWTLN